MLAAAPTKPELAKAERAKRELARRHLIDYSKYIAPWYTPARHHIYLAEKLEQVKLFIETKGQQGIGRLLICEPAQYGNCLLYTSPSPRDRQKSRMPSSA